MLFAGPLLARLLPRRLIRRSEACHTFLPTDDPTAPGWARGATSGQHDFRTLKDAVDSLNLAGAICDSVVFELHDTTWSAYKSQYEISDIVGTSPTSPIIIRPEAHNQYLTRVWFDSCSEDFNEVFLLKNLNQYFLHKQ